MILILIIFGLGVAAGLISGFYMAGQRKSQSYTAAVTYRKEQGHG